LGCAVFDGFVQKLFHLNRRLVRQVCLLAAEFALLLAREGREEKRESFFVLVGGRGRG
jgi:hypothetical protein